MPGRRRETNGVPNALKAIYVTRAEGKKSHTAKFELPSGSVMFHIRFRLRRRSDSAPEDLLVELWAVPEEISLRYHTT